MTFKLKFAFLFIVSQTILLFTLAAAGQINPPSAKKDPTEIIIKFKDATLSQTLNSQFVAVKRIRSNELFSLNAPLPLKDFFIKYTEEGRPTFPEFKESRIKLQGMRSKLDDRLYKRFQRAPKGSAPEKAQLDRVFTFKISKDKSAQEALKSCQAVPDFEYCQLNYPIEFFQANPINPTTNPFFNSSGTWGQSFRDMWGLEKIEAEKAWGISSGEYLDDTGNLTNIIVAVIDTGVDYNHPDMWDNIWVNPDVIQDTNNDGKITLDDADKNGNKKLEQNEYLTDMFGTDIGNPFARNLHGTHVAGTIAAVSNDIGIIGVAPRAKIMPIVPNLDSPIEIFMTEVGQCIRLAVDNGADVINNSWGCTRCGPSSPVLEEALQYAYNSGVINVFAAGNGGDDNTSFSPQNMTTTKPIVVAASNPEDKPGSFSRQVMATSYGVAVDVFAPGGGVTGNDPPIFQPGDNVLSLFPVDESFRSESVIQDIYFRAAGTSMSAPHASGVIALLLAHKSNLNIEEVRQIIRVSSDKVNPSTLLPFNMNQSLGTGRINAFKALTQDTVLQAKINFPNKDTRLGLGQVSLNIQGIAWGEGFEHYQFFYVKTRDIVSGQTIPWVPITEIGMNVQPVENGPLGIWNLTNLVPGGYILKLEVTAENGQVFKDMVRIAVPQEGDSWATTEMINPVPGSLIASSEPTFQWQPARRNGDPFILTNLIAAYSEDWLTIYDAVNAGENTSVQLHGIPLNGQPINVIVTNTYSDAQPTDGTFRYETANQPLLIFIRGDADNSGEVNLTDAVYTLNQLFRGSDPFFCPDAVDANDDGAIDISDPIKILRALFVDSSGLPAPWPNPGIDPTVDNLTCQ